MESHVNKLELDRTFINTKLQESNLAKFNDTLIKTINVLFENEESNDVIDSFIDFLFNLTNNHGIENMVLVGNTKNNNYLKNRLFPNKQEMYRMYPEAQKHSKLMAIFYIRRIYDRIKQGYLNKAISEVKVNNSIDPNKVNKTNELFINIGLK